jgi:cation diffusion facilitator CzcD-associated flavoprotein CzcO
MRVAVIGAGFSGIAAGIALKRQGITDFTIFDSAPGVGGTWRHNRYPGAEVDLESASYSFSYAPADWSRTHASRGELQGYLERVVNAFGLRSHLALNETVRSVTWLDDRGEYEIASSPGAPHGPFHVVISAVGFLSVPRIPALAREGTGFGGVICHTAGWPDGLDLTGKRVGVLGTGSSAVQVVAEAAKCAAEVKVFQREPNWLLPKGSRDFSPSERRMNRRPLVRWWRRFNLYLRYDLRQLRMSHARRDGWVNRRRRRASEMFLADSLARRPELRRLLTPTFPFEGKRTVLSDTYYQTLLQPHVALVPHGVKGLSATGVIDENGDRHDLDVVVLATGFDAANYLSSLKVIGLGGRQLHEVWAGAPRAFLGMMVPGFPNFFMMYGPNTNSVPLISFYEAQARFAARAIRRLASRSAHDVQVSPAVAGLYDRWLQRALKRTVWADTDSYFRSPTGRVVSQWPFNASLYLAATGIGRLALRYRRRTAQPPGSGPSGSATEAAVHDPGRSGAPCARRLLSRGFDHGCAQAGHNPP